MKTCYEIEKSEIWKLSRILIKKNYIGIALPNTIATVESKKQQL